LFFRVLLSKKEKQWGNLSLNSKLLRTDWWFRLSKNDIPGSIDYSIRAQKDIRGLVLQTTMISVKIMMPRNNFKIYALWIITSINMREYTFFAIWESANWTRQFGIRQTGNREFGMLPSWYMWNNILLVYSMFFFLQFTCQNITHLSMLSHRAFMIYKYTPDHIVK
jgi:hypothetical protein